MSSTFMGTPYSPSSPPATSSSTTMSPTISPSYPDRPIRPLPKRSLKDRLSSEAADSIAYPPAPPSTGAPFYIPYLDSLTQRNGPMMRSALRELDNAVQQKQNHIEDERGAYQFRGKDQASEDEDEVGIVRRYQDYQQRQTYGTLNGASHDPDNGQSIASSNDSADGYDSFENTNNKKKRKIPTSANLNASMSTSLSQDLANMGLSNKPEDLTDRVANGTMHYSSVAIPVNTAGTGIAGAGRGRFGRNGRRDASGRQPLHSSINGSNAWSNGKIPASRKESAAKESINGDRGIISQAIADAAALSSNLNHGQENVSLLEQQTPKKSSSANTQFTFTYEPDTSNKPIWPGENNMTPATHYDHQAPSTVNSHPPPTGHHARKDFSTHGTQTSPPMSTQPGQDSHGTIAAEAPRKPRRSAAKRYALADRERRAQQEYNNSIHSLKDEDFWICEFCEYESIFGRPPEALIRQYEMKDEKERKRQAEKRRLLEKAKMKGRKGKKGGKNHAKGANNLHSPPPLPPQPPYDPTMSGQYQGYDHGVEDEYYGDEYDEPGPTPAPSPEMLSQLSHMGNHAQGHPTGVPKKVHAT